MRDVNDKLDRAIEDTFPASDPIANTPETGIFSAEPAEPSADEVRDNRAARRFEIAQDGHTAVLRYERKGQQIVLVQTEVPEPIRGRGLADKLAQFALAQSHAEGLRVVVLCPFVRAYLRKHLETGSMS